MECHTHTEGGYCIVTLEGEVDLHCSPRARQEILKNLEQNHPVLVDLSKVDYIDSSGIASLVEGFQVAKSQQLDFGLVGVSEAAHQVLQLARLDKVFSIHDSVSEHINKS